MAMAVRCGWAHVVEWLHLNRPESAKSMSELAINDAAKWGHVDVLRVCDKYKLAPFTATAMRLAARAGQVEVVKWLHSLEDDKITVHAAIDAAIVCDRVEVLHFLRVNCKKKFKRHHLTLSLRSSAPLADDVMQVVWTGWESDSEARRLVEPEFAQICAARSEAIVALVVPFMGKNVSTIIAGMEAAEAAGRHAIVELIPRIRTKSVVHEIFQYALQHAYRTSASARVPCGRLSAYDLATTYRLLLAGDKSIAFTEQAFFSGGWAARCAVSHEQASTLEYSLERERCAAAGDERCAAKKGLLRNKDRRDRYTATSIKVLQNTSALEVVAFLLLAQPSLYAERIVFDTAPSCFKPQLMRFLLYRREQSTALATTATTTAATTTTEAKKKMKTTRETTFTDITRQVGGFLTVDEVERIEAAKSDELNAWLKQDHRDLLAPTFLVDAVRVEKYHLFAYIHNVLALTDLTDEHQGDVQLKTTGST